MLHHHLLDNMSSLNIAAEEDAITSYVFKQLEQMPLVDRFEAYQLFADKWQTISQDLEIIQSEGFEATRVVDANMVVKKKDDKEYEVQDGWIGRILPFELVQSTYLKSEWQALHNKEERLDMVGSEIEETLGELADDERDGITNDDGVLDKKSLESKLAEALEEVEPPEILALNEYLLLSKKKDKIGSADFSGWRRKYQESSVANLNMKNLMSPTPRNRVLRALILALKDSADPKSTDPIRAETKELKKRVVKRFA